jgi:hypothetical protein
MVEMQRGDARPGRRRESENCCRTTEGVSPKAGPKKLFDWLSCVIRNVELQALLKEREATVASLLSLKEESVSTSGLITIGEQFNV